MKIALVYQAGIANVFNVGEFSHDAAGRSTTTRLLQHAFKPCEWYARGLLHAGADVRAYGCNEAGDITARLWSDDRGPFAKETCWPT